MRPPRSPSRFSEVLRTAIDATGMSLREISDLLAELDEVTVSRSTLSNWQCARVPRRSPEEDERIYALERVLQLRRGELVLLLEETAVAPSGGDEEVRALRTLAGQLGGVSNCITIAVDDTLQVADRKPQRRTVRQVVRAIATNADCYWTIYSPDAAGPRVPFEPLHGCRVGRIVPHGDLIAVELLFDRILQLGESHEFGFRIVEQGLSSPVRDCRRWAGPPALERLQMSVAFDLPPRQVAACQWNTRKEQPHSARAVPIIDGIARLRMSHPVTGMYGLSWRW